MTSSNRIGYFTSSACVRNNKLKAQDTDLGNPTLSARVQVVTSSLCLFCYSCLYLNKPKQMQQYITDIITVPSIMEKGPWVVHHTLDLDWGDGPTFELSLPQLDTKSA